MIRPPELQPPTLPDLDRFTGIRHCGRITKLVGLTLESAGPASSIGDVVSIGGSHGRPPCLAEVVGFRDRRLLLMPLESTDGIRPGDLVTQLDRGLTVNVGEALLGRVIDGLGRPLDGSPLPRCEAQWPLRRAAPPPLLRSRIDAPFHTGVRAIDAAITMGQGQRVGIFAGSGVGKSTLLGMACRNSVADLNVIALIGERGKEVREFLEDTLGEEGMRRSVVVAATSDCPALQRLKGAETAIAIAEYFRGRGKSVLLVMDSLTRYAMAQREVGLAIGEPPATRGYPPSVFARLPELLERAGNDQRGSITGIYTVLVEGDDLNDPIADCTRSLLDGHVVLTRELANEGHYPPIDVAQSVSRVMNQVTTHEHQLAARDMRHLLTVRRKAAELVEFGLYKPGASAEIDRALARSPFLDRFLRQEIDDNAAWSATWPLLLETLGT